MDTRAHAAQTALVTAVILALAGLAALPLAAAADSPPTSRWIVQLQPGASLDRVIGSAHARLGVSPGQRFSHVMRGFAASLTEAQRAALLADPDVEAVVPDAAIAAAGDPYPPTDTEIQPGIQRVGATANVDRAGHTLDVDIAILDTGIQPDNLELTVAGGYNCTNPAQDEAARSDPANWRDSATFGHGTHVAGIAGAIENGRGVAGVAQGARLWAIKVLNSSGNGYWSWVMCGLDHVAAMRDPSDASVPRIEVVNMSIASGGWDDGDCGLSNSDLLHQAICRVTDAGITIVAAAGNDHRDAAGYVPGAYDEVITVSAMADWDGGPGGSGSPPSTGCPHHELDDAFANFSNFGADVDLIAPGVCVLSTLPVDRLGRMSGTSMATPHVTGGAALYYLEEARLGRPRPTPPQVRAALIASGTTDWLTSTDGDRKQAGSVREPALQLRDLDLPPSFTIGADSQIVRIAAGTRARTGLWVARLGGFDSSVTFHVESATLPKGASATFDSQPRLSIDVPASAAPGAYHVALSATGGGRDATAGFLLVVYNAEADPGGPTAELRSGVRAGTINLPIRLSWPAVAKAKRYKLQQSVDGGDWVTIAKPYKTHKAANAWPGRRYQYRVSAKVGGTWREWKVGPSIVVTAHEPGPEIDLVGTWQAAPLKGAYSELPVYSTTAGSSATFQFVGTSVTWMSTRGPDRGRAEVRIDGQLVATIDLRADRRKVRAVVFAQSWSSAGQHTLRIDVLGTASRPRVDIDAFVTVSS